MASAPAACLRRPLSEAQPQLEGARTGLGVLRAQLEADRRPNALRAGHRMSTSSLW